MYRVIKKVKSPKYLVITPLKSGDKISKKTKKGVKKNKLPFDWVYYEGDNNIPINTTLALEQYRKKCGHGVDYIIKVDNDVYMDNGLLDEMYYVLKNSGDDVGYAYCGFSFIHELGMKTTFNKEFTVSDLLQHNYISSNSMIKFDALDKVGGFVTDEKYERLLDWALWLKFLYYGYRGVRIGIKGFETPLNKDGVSARGRNDYQIKRQRVIQDFVLPIREVIKDVK